MENKRVLDIIYNIIRPLSQYGINSISTVATICSCLNRIMWEMKFQNIDDILQFPDYEIEKILKTPDTKVDFSIFYKMQSENGIHYVISDFKKLLKENRKDIANCIQKIIDGMGNKLGLLITDNFSIKVMQAFAKQMQNNGLIIDPCCGSGRLLKGFDNYKTMGYEINNEIAIISQTYLNLLSSESDYKNLETNIKIENFLYNNLDSECNYSPATYIFDPPLHVQLELLGDLHYQLNSHGIYSLNNNIFSEYAFLAKILFEQKNTDANYICIFTNNFLFTQSKFVMSFKRYLMENSLIAVIQSNFSENNKIQKLILVGKNKLDNPQNSLRYFITPKDKNISEDDISRIVQKCLNNETFDEKEFYNIAKIKAYTLQEIRENDYQVSMPQYFVDETNPNEIKSLTQIVDDLKASNQKLIETSNDLEIVTTNLLNGIKNIQKSNIEEPDIKSQNISETSQKDVSVNKWFNVEYSDLNNAIGIFSNDKVLDWTPIDFKNTNNIYVDDIYSCVNNLKLLYKAKRLRYRNGFLEIYSKENLDSSQEIKNFSDYIIEDNQNNDYIITMLNNISTKQIDIFNAFIKLHFDDENVFDKFTTSDVHSAIATFKVLGLLYVLPNVDNELEKYFPYIPLLNIKEEY